MEEAVRARRRKVSFHGVWTLALICATSLRAHTLPVRLFTIADGLPRNFAQCLTPGRNGSMWFCTTEGLVRFDGYQMRVFGTAHGLPSNAVWDMEPARDGGYWLVTEAGVCHLGKDSRIGERCQALKSSGPVKYRGARVFESRDGRVWLQTRTQVLRLDPSHQQIDLNGPRFEIGTQLNAIVDGPAGELLIGANTGLYRWMPGNAPIPIAARTLGGGVSDILSLGSDLYWVAAGAGLFSIGLRGSMVSEQRLLPRALSFGLVYRGPSGRIWATSVDTLFHLEAGEGGSARVLDAYTNADGLPKVLANFLAEDSQGSLWGAAGGTGVFRMNDSGVRSYSGSDGLGSARIASIFEDRSGTVCVMTSWDGTDLRAYNGSRFRTIAVPYPPGVGHSWGWHQLALQARSGEWWFPTSTGPLRLSASTVDALPRAQQIARYSHETGMPHPSVFRIFEDAAGDLWFAAIGSDPTIARRDHRSGAFIPYAIGEPGEPPPLVLAIQESRHGGVWLGTDRGLYRLRGDRFVPVLKGAAGRRVIADLLFDRQGRLWAASSLYGLLRFDSPEMAEPSFVAYTVSDGLSANSIKAVVEGQNGFIFAATVAGIDRIDPQAGPNEHKVRRFSTADGLPSAEPTTAFRDSQGRIWIGTENGLIRFDPAQMDKLARPDPVITSLRVRGEDQPIAWDGSLHLELQLPAERNQVEIGYAATAASPGARFQYRLGDKPWSEQSGQAATYPALPYGRSRFEVRIINADGDVSAAVASVDVDVLAPLWRRSWFLSLAALASIGLGTTVYRARVAQLLAIANLRTHIATDLHDDIGANLTQIAILSEVALRDGKTALLKEISGIARDTVAQMSDIVWAISPSHDGFDSLIHRLRRFAEDTLGGAGIDLTFEVSGLERAEAAPLEMRRPLFLIFKEAIHNIVRHSRASHAWIAFEITQGRAKVTVDDDGRGFDLARVQPGGEGIASIRSRAARLGGSATWTSRPGSGTRLIVSIPLGRKAAKRGGEAE